MISGILAGLLMLASSASAADADWPALVERLAAAGDGKLAFVETRRSELLDEPLEVRGTLARRDDGTLVRRIHRPSTETQILTPQHIEIRRDDGFRHRYSLRRAPELAVLRNALDHLLAGRAEALGEAFAVRMHSGDDGAWRLELSPRPPELAETVEGLVLAGSNDRLESLELILADGERIRTEILPAQP